MAKTLREIRPVRQADAGLHRRWFTCVSLDLFAWERDGVLEAFEICYDKPHDEHVLRWTRAGGFSHRRIDDGEASPRRNDTPIAVPDGRFDLAAIALRFEAVGAAVEPRLYRRVLGALLSG